MHAGGPDMVPGAPDPLGQDRAADNAHGEQRECDQGGNDRLGDAAAGALCLLIKGVQQEQER